MGSSRAAVSFLTKLAASFAFGAAGAASIINTSTYTVGCGERAIILNRFGGVMKESLGEGTHFVIPWRQKPIISDVAARTHSFAPVSQTRDLQWVNLRISMQSRPDASRLPDIYKTIGISYGENVIAPCIRDEVQDVVGQLHADELLSHWVRVSAVLRERLISRAKEDFNILLDDQEKYIEFGVP
ncbi:prohibitin-3, mitochondrial-like [Momordica charantia]|uniref:Prohibitin n=1 Tax=Momordica charantia TaxID=3673 RepID=A0A6J1BYH4_MOMCH|nr:prohibitin-3, mitochondrial-like [Momordica charantia]